MKTTPFRFLAPILCLGFAWSAMPSPAHAANDGIRLLLSVSTLKAQEANDEAIESVTKLDNNRIQKELIRISQRQFELSAQPPEDAAPQVSHAGRVVENVAAIAAFESTASADGLDDAERKSLADLVDAAQQSVVAARADASTAIANAKKLLEETKAADDKNHIKLYLKSLRATAKAHRQTAAALRTLAKKLAKPTR